MGWACSRYGVEEKCVRGFGGGDLTKGDHLADRRRRDDNIKMDLQDGGETWTGLLWLRIGTGWRALVNAVMHVLFYKMWGLS